MAICDQLTNLEACCAANAAAISQLTTDMAAVIANQATILSKLDSIESSILDLDIGIGPLGTKLDAIAGEICDTLVMSKPEDTKV